MPQVLKFGSKNLNGENWFVHHPNGKHMFTCGEKRAMWYLDKELADRMKKPFSIQLNYEPKGFGFDEDDIFGLAGREIRCVVTNDTEGLQRHHIVPYCYRTHFPYAYKSKNHHDVVLVTYKIHENYEREATVYKNEMSNIYSVPTLNELNLEYTKILSEYSNDKVKLLSKFHSIFKNNGNVPQHIIEANLMLVSDYTGIPLKTVFGYNYIQLYKLYLLIRDRHSSEFEKFKSENRNKFDHGFHIVSKLDTHEKLEDFIKMWRNHFVNTMNPQYMPIGWSINYKVRVEL